MTVLPNESKWVLCSKYYPLSDCSCCLFCFFRFQYTCATIPAATATRSKTAIAIAAVVPAELPPSLPGSSEKKSTSVQAMWNANISDYYNINYRLTIYLLPNNTIWCYIHYLQFVYHYFFISILTHETYSVGHSSVLDISGVYTSDGLGSVGMKERYSPTVLVPPSWYARGWIDLLGYMHTEY